MISTIESPGATDAPYAEDPRLPQIRSADACRAIGCTAQWLKNHVSRTPPVVLLLPAEREDRGDRQYLKLTRQSVVHLALVRRLERYMAPREAHLVATGFTYVGDSVATAGQDREPGMLFAEGRTLLFARPEGEGICTPLDPGDRKAGREPTAAFDMIFKASRGAGVGEPMIVLDVSRVADDVAAQLGLGRAY
jgi:hypothetical protein